MGGLHAHRKVDADVELPRGFFERALHGEFDADRELGMAGGIMAERRLGAWRRVGSPATHAAPPARVYSRACLADVGSRPRELGWDTIDETKARLLGYRTRAFEDLHVRHHRAAGTADGALGGRARHGRCAYIAHQPIPWVLVRAVKVGLTFRPRGSVRSRSCGDTPAPVARGRRAARAPSCAVRPFRVPGARRDECR